MTEGSSLVGATFVVAASALWGTTGTVATFAPEVSPIAIGAAAMGIGGLLQALIGARAIGRSRTALLAQWRVVVLGAIAVAIYPLAFYTSMHLAGVAVGTVVSIGSAPLVAAIIERIADHRPVTTRWAIAAACGIAGVALLCAIEAGGATETGGAADAPGVSVLGIALGLVAGLSYAVYSWAAHRVMHSGVSSRAAMGSIFGSAGLLLMPVLVVTGAPFLASWSNAGVGLYMASVPMFAGYLLFGMGLARVHASTATLLSLVEPVVAAVLAVTIVGERVPFAAWIGVALVLGSLAVLTVPLARRRTQATAGQGTSSSRVTSASERDPSVSG